MMYDDDDTEFESADEATQFEPCPWGSRQRLLPRTGFKAAVSVVPKPLPPPPAPRIAVPVIAPAPAALVAPAFPTLPIAVADAEPIRRDRERYIATERVPRVPMLLPKPSQLRRRLTIIALPTVALALGGMLALVFARPASPRVETASQPPLALVDEPGDRVYSVASVEEPPALAIAQPMPTPHKHVKLARVMKRPVLAFDTSTPLGDLAHRRH